MKKWRDIRLLLLLLAALAAGCSGMRSGMGYSYTAEAVPEKTAAGIALDAAGHLARLYPPGRTTLYLRLPVTSSGEPAQEGFGPLLDRELRAKGFTLANARGQGPELVWIVDSLGQQKTKAKENEQEVGGNWYLRLQVADTTGMRTYSRVYDLNGLAQGSLTSGRRE